MESITKNRQPPAVLRAMIERAYGPDRVPHGEDWAQELGHGWFNVAYRIRLRDGVEVVLKIAPPPGVEVLAYERGAMGIELAALELIRKHTEVPVPTVDFADRAAMNCATRTTSSCRSSTPTISASSRTSCRPPNATPTTSCWARPTAS